MAYGGGPMALNPLVENGIRLKISDLTRGKPLRPHSHLAGRLTWTSYGQVLASVSYELTTSDISGLVRLIYEARPRDGEPVSMDYTIGLVTTEQPGGAPRFWFWCGRGQAMASTLYKLQGSTVFASRRAFTRPLSYRTQRISVRDRNLEKAQRIRASMGGSVSMFDEFPGRPARMWSSTYARKKAEAEAAAGVSLALLEQHLERTGYRERVFGCRA